MAAIHDDPRTSHTTEADRSHADLARWIPPVLLAAVLVAFAGVNTQRTTVHLAFTTVRAPLFVVLAATAALGAAIALLAKTIRKHRHH